MAGIGEDKNMKVLLTSAGLETEEIKECFMEMAGKDMSMVKALFIPTAAVNADAIAVLPKCMNDLLKCGIPNKNIRVYDMHYGMELEELQQYDVVYCVGVTPIICWKESMIQNLMNRSWRISTAMAW